MLAFATSIAYVPGWFSPFLNTGWLALGGGLLLAQGRQARLGLAHWLGFAFLCYAGASLTWSPDPLSGWIKLFQLSLLGGAFWYGSTCDSLDHLYIGLGLGVGISGLVALAQWADLLPSILVTSSWPGGLFGNSAIMAQSAALALVPLILLKLWRHVPLPALALVLGNSRAAWIVLFIGTVRSRSWAWPAALIGLLACVILTPRGVDVRLEIWEEILRTTTLWGHGLGSFAYDSSAGYVLHAHNDFLELLSELGIDVGLLVAITLFCFESQDGVAKTTFFCYLLIALIAFPIFVPVLALYGGALAGYLCRRNE